MNYAIVLRTITSVVGLARAATYRVFLAHPRLLTVRLFVFVAVATGVLLVINFVLAVYGMFVATMENVIQRMVLVNVMHVGKDI